VVASLLAVVAFAAAFAVAHDTGSTETSRPAAAPLATPTTAPPTVHNLERVEGISALRPSAGPLPSGQAAAAQVVTPGPGSNSDVENPP
jgi:hypothetical protein